MAVSPKEFEPYARFYRDQVDEAENLMIRRIRDRLFRGVELSDWETKKLSEILQLKGDIRTEIIKLRKQDAKVAQAFEAAYNKGREQARADIAETKIIYPTVDSGDLGLMQYSGLQTAINQPRLDALIGKAIDNLKSTHLAIFRTTEDAYRQVIAEATSQAVLGTMTKKDAVQAALNRFADRGITGFTDSKGRNWDLSSYSEMAVASTLGQAGIQGHLDQLADSGYDLVIVSTSSGCCDICMEWESRVLSISGLTPGYPTVQEARDAGLWHPNCGHTVSIYLHGHTKIETPLPVSERRSNYEQSQRQRQLERGIRQWKRRDAAAETPEAKRLATNKVRQWQSAMRDHIDKTGGTRSYWREQDRTTTEAQKQAARDKLDTVVSARRAEKKRVSDILQADIRDGKYPLNLKIQQQRKHIPGTMEFQREVDKGLKKSFFLTMQEADIQNLVQTYAGHGIIAKIDKRSTHPEEIVKLPRTEGMVWVDWKQTYVPSRYAQIRYSKRGVHVLFVIPKRDDLL